MVTRCYRQREGLRVCGGSDGEKSPRRIDAPSKPRFCGLGLLALTLMLAASLPAEARQDAPPDAKQALPLPAVAATTFSDAIAKLSFGNTISLDSPTTALPFFARFVSRRRSAQASSATPTDPPGSTNNPANNASFHQRCRPWKLWSAESVSERLRPPSVFLRYRIRGEILWRRSRGERRAVDRSEHGLEWRRTRETHCLS